MTNAFIFPGQGSQKIGMGKDLYDSFPIAKEVFQEVDDALSLNLSKIIFFGDEEELKLTINAQPALMTVSFAIVRVIEEMTGKKLSEIGNFSIFFLFMPIGVVFIKISEYLLFLLFQLSILILLLTTSFFFLL